MYPGILVQMITTRQPTMDMIEVAIVSMEQALKADGEALPLGSGTLPRDVLDLPKPAAADGAAPVPGAAAGNHAPHGPPSGVAKGGAAGEAAVTIDPPLPGA
jgi:hypothetical protein